MDCFRSLVTILAFWTLIPACIVYVDEDENEDDDHHEFVVYNHSPEILSDLTWWACDYDWVALDHYFEFQATVEDLDGFDDVTEVSVTLYEAGTDYVLDSYALQPEGGGVWGGFVWESESYAFCGEALDVLVEAIDWYDDWDHLWLLY